MVSLAPKDAVAGSGLLSDVDVLFAKVRFVMYDYGGKRDDPSPVIHAVLETAGDDGKPEQVNQYWSIGSARSWKPSEDGKQVIPVGKQTSLNDSSNGMIFLSSLVAAGFPEDELAAGDISVLDGLRAHVVRQKVPRRAGINYGNSERDPEVLVVTEIKSLPGEELAKKAAGGKKAKAGTTPAVNIEEAAAGLILQVLGELEDGETIAKAKIGMKVMAAAKKDASVAAEAAAITKLAMSEEFLARDGQPWAYADGIISAAV